ncbi:endonuclease/exonuclease/phosphatase family protein [Vibrio artabrorum]|uniref:UPF0294 protein QWY96_10510 n=1 Tax=Vibrio artabrorum TaxID=446374 RepID=A0ABT8CIK3_9VIBR|nr:endonuclease/exonuclease/phosphatase family protein [Vibrio artabrorum]MDN3701209.1 endonuclease/exonuclease/phosphatase family protein [Vibrio artabrorum]
MFKKIIIVIAVLITLAVVSFHIIFVIPNKPNLITFSHNASNDIYSCYQNPAPKAIDVSDGLSLAVWNIYKQNRSHWQSELDKLSTGKDLVLLQEASMTQELRQWMTSGQWESTHVNAFEAFEESAGVLNLATHSPLEACAYTHEEPWLRLPKSALWSRYQLSNGEVLAVINIHAVNFTFGTQDYEEQLESLTNNLQKYRGPVIFAGDFNSWSEARFAVLKEALEKVGLTEVAFAPDNRTQFITGLMLDHVFYRGLDLEKAKTPITDASDHNPMLVTFQAQ